MKLRTPYHIAKYQNRALPIRPLTENEIYLAKSVFGNLIDYKSVKIVNYPYVFWQSDDIFIAPNGWIFVGDKHYKVDFALCNQSYQQTFIHEMTHVLQYQHGLRVLFRGAVLQSFYYLTFKKYNPYHYTFKENKSFWDYNIEQQGCIAEQIYLNNLPNIILQAKERPIKKPSSDVIPRTCPHEDCGQTFTYVVQYDGICFCPHCERSVLINPITEHLQQQSIFAFFINNLKKYSPTFFKVSIAWLIFAVIFEIMFNHPVFVLAVVVFVIFFVAIIASSIGDCFITDADNNTTTRLIYSEPLSGGVDVLPKLQANPKNYMYSESIKDLFKPFAHECPHCHSQRIIQKYKNHYYCDNCQTQLTINPKIIVWDTIFSILYGFSIPIAMIPDLDWWAFNVLFFIVLISILGLIRRFIIIKIKKWR